VNHFFAQSAAHDLDSLFVPAKLPNGNAQFRQRHSISRKQQLLPRAHTLHSQRLGMLLRGLVHQLYQARYVAVFAGGYADPQPIAHR
jgi:hypothetical protein